MVAGIKDRKTGRVKMWVVRGEGPKLSRFVESNVERGTMIYTDEASSYRSLDHHEAVTHGIGEYVRGQATINGMESFWALLKRGYTGTFHRMSIEHLHRYVAEFEGRHNMRDLDTIRQMGLMVRGFEGKRLRYRDLTAHRRGRRAKAV